MCCVSSMKNSKKRKTDIIKSHTVLNFNNDVKVIKAIKYGSYKSATETFE